MTTKDTGGPAFPTEYFYDENTGRETLPSEGMTLRQGLSHAVTGKNWLAERAK